MRSMLSACFVLCIVFTLERYGVLDNALPGGKPPQVVADFRQSN